MPEANFVHVAVIGLLVAVLVTGNVAANDAPTDSDFIDNLPVLQSDDMVDGLFSWEVPESWASKYDRFIIQTIEFFIHPESEYRGIDAVDFQTLADALRIHLIDALEPRYPVVSKPGSGIALIRIAITGVNLEKRPPIYKGAYGNTLWGRAVNRSQEPMVNLDEASMEMEILDSSTGERLGVAIDPMAMRHGKGKYEWESMNEAFKLYASNIRQYMDNERKK